MVRRLLLDSHVLLWIMEDNPRLGPDVRRIIADPGNQIHVSAVSIWELALKRSLGKLQAPENLVAAVREYDLIELPVTFDHAEQAGNLPQIHRDPFDRMLVAQAQAEGLELVTSDTRIPRYGICTVRV